MSDGRGELGRGELEIGRVVGVFGFRGEVKLHLDNPTSHLLDTPFPMVLVAPDGARRPAKVSARKGAGKRVLGRVEGVADEAAARALQGHRLFVRVADLPAPEEGELYVWQLEGAEVVEAGAVVGKVVDVQASGPVAILEIDHGAREPAFVPLTATFVAEAVPGRITLVPGALAE